MLVWHCRRTRGEDRFQRSQVGAIYVLALNLKDTLLLGKGRKGLKRIKRKLMRHFSMTDTVDGSLVLGMEVNRGRTKGAVTIAQKKVLGILVGAVRDGELQPCVYARCGKIIFIGPAGGKVFEQRRQATFPGYHGQSSAPRTGDLVRRRARRQPIGAGDFQTF